MENAKRSISGRQTGKGKRKKNNKERKTGVKMKKKKNGRD